MTTIVAFSGSLRAASFNTALLQAAKNAFPDVIELASIRAIPLYDADLESSEGVPAPVEALKERIAQADGLLIASPEYNNSIPGVLKNAVDWLTRPPEDIPRVFYGKPVAIMGASAGNFGTILAQNAWLPVLRALRTRHWLEGRMMVPRGNQVVNDQGELTDPKTRELLEAFVRGFISFTQG
jgi:NAD(P)H-dependent FMN reductase